MRLTRHMETTGANLFRWRSYLLLAFLPLLFLTAYNGEVIEHQVGPFWGDAFEIGAILLVVTGQALRIFTVGYVPRGTSGRNTHDQRAEELNTTGIYALVRNPLYLANCMMYLGIALFSQNLVISMAMALILLPYYERIIAAEESYLSAKFGAAYDTWAEHVPAFVPRLTGWVPPSMPFSVRSVITREQSSVVAAVVALYLLEYALHNLGGEAEVMSPLWHWALGLALVLKLAAHLAKHHTTWLRVEGR